MTGRQVDERLNKAIRCGNARLPKLVLAADQRAEDIARAMVAEVSTFSDPALRLVIAQRLLDCRGELRDIQTLAVRELKGRGWSWRAIASLLGCAKSWIQALHVRETG